jgi:hypothetical protein
VVAKRSGESPCFHPLVQVRIWQVTQCGALVLTDGARPVCVARSKASCLSTNSIQRAKRGLPYRPNGTAVQPKVYKDASASLRVLRMF